ncbi:MAG: hypothetical protein Q9204_006336, partial [Flavoplaca sp. TL-2023a]
QRLHIPLRLVPLSKQHTALLKRWTRIFRKCHSIFTVVKTAKNEPQRYGKKGELIIRYEGTEEHRQRQASFVSTRGTEKLQGEQVENVDHHHPNARL